MGEDPYQAGYGGRPNPGFSGHDKMVYDTARDQRALDHQRRLNEEARLWARPRSTGPRSGGSDAGGQGGAATEGGGAGLLALAAFGLMLGVMAVGLALVPVVLVMATFAWPVPRLMRGTARREWRIGRWRAWLVMFLGLWVAITLAVLVGGSSWYLGAARWHTGLSGAVARPLGGLIELVRVNLVAGALPWTGLSHVAARQWGEAAATAGLPMLAAFAATLMRLERPAFAGLGGFLRAGGIGLVALLAGTAGLAASLAALGFAAVRLVG